MPRLSGAPADAPDTAPACGAPTRAAEHELDQQPQVRGLGPGAGCHRVRARALGLHPPRDQRLRLVSAPERRAAGAGHLAPLHHFPTFVRLGVLIQSAPLRVSRDPAA
jgi:hypothetical protein